MSLSREGKRFFLTTSLIGFAALNTGNNLIYLIFSLMLSLTILSFAILVLNLSKISLKILAEQPAFAKKSLNLLLILRNNKKLSTYSIWIKQAGNNGKVYVPEIKKGSKVEKMLSVVYEKRGVYGYNEFLIESSFPFLFLSKRVIKHIEGSVYVYPEIKEIEDLHFEFYSIERDTLLSKRFKGDDFSFVREFRYGDDWRKIHWKSSAKMSKIMVRDSISQEAKKITLILDNLEPQDDEVFEKAIVFTASLANKFIEDGYFVRLITGNSVVPFGFGKEHLYKLLDELTILKKSREWKKTLSVEQEGFTVLISGSHNSSIVNLFAITDSVVYAESL